MFECELPNLRSVDQTLAHSVLEIELNLVRSNRHRLGGTAGNQRPVHRQRIVSVQPEPGHLLAFESTRVHLDGVSAKRQRGRGIEAGGGSCQRAKILAAVRVGHHHHCALHGRSAGIGNSSADAARGLLGMRRHSARRQYGSTYQH